MKLKNSIEPLKKAYKERLAELANCSGLTDLSQWLRMVRVKGDYKNFYERVRWDLWYLIHPHKREEIIKASASYCDVFDDHIDTLLKQVFTTEYIDNLEDNGETEL